MASTATLRDDFANNTIDRPWTSAVSGSATAAESGGQAVLTLPSATAGSHSAYYRSRTTYDLTGDAFSFTIGTMVATGVAATAQLDLFQDTSNIYRWRQLSGTLTARTVVAGVDTQLYSVAWNATTFKYLRIRESGGTVYFDSSSNGTSWTNRASVLVSAAFPVTGLTIQFGAECGNIASPGSLRLDDVNLLSLSTTWRWVEISRTYQHRIGSVSIAATSGVGYLAIAASLDASGNLVSPRYFAGPQHNGYELVEQSSQAAAQAMAIDLPANGRWQLPPTTFVEGRYARLYLRSEDGSSFTLREFYARRYVQADDIEAESIKALHIAANTITADRLNVTQLSAITADMGSITAGTVTGATIRTAASGARIELTSPNGLRSYNSSNVLQVQIRTSDGALTWGGGNGVLDAAGIRLVTSTSSTVDATRALTLQMPSTAVASLTGYETAGRSVMQATMTAAGSSRSADYEVIMRAQAGSPQAGITISAPWAPGGTPTIVLDGYVQGLQVQQASDFAGQVDVHGGYLRALSGSNNPPTSGAGLELVHLTSNNTGYLIGFNRSTAAYTPVEIDASKINIGANGSYTRFGDTTAPSYVIEAPNVASAAGQGRANAWVTYSSEVWKERIRVADRATFRAKLKQLRAVEYDNKPEIGGGSSLGLIAEEVAPIWPELVSGDLSKPETLGLDYGRLGALLLPVVQELIDQVERLQADVARLNPRGVR